MRGLFYFWQGFCEMPLKPQSKDLWEITLSYNKKAQKAHNQTQKAYLSRFKRLVNENKALKKA